MMKTQVILLVVVVVMAATAAAGRQPSYSYSAPRTRIGSGGAPRTKDFVQYSANSREANYDFSYAVKDDYSSNDFGHQESRDGDNTHGSYYVHLPDGRLQTVTYYVDGDSGYVADVSYQGEAQYPAYESRKAPVYAPHRSHYIVSNSDESFEVPFYSSPRRSYGFH
ncbi:pro-resilin-like [Homarus americanus]|uniref:Pro-resilin-like 16 n=1 Tax=Homarus americanus TaxID=6706 RepID=A0A8J5K495_HOMAM|nr:pro-resilin-like [Homarus americanus]KAG7166333.1 Pro-resilin-like 16 [Homarus americanus]